MILEEARSPAGIHFLLNQIIALVFKSLQGQLHYIQPVSFLRVGQNFMIKLASTDMPALPLG
jgi:hypothetical protein